MIAVARRTAPATELRAEYLDSLPEPQELFVESLVAAGTWWSIRRQDQEIGYAVIGSGLDLLELYLRNDALKHLTEAFDALVEVCDVRSILAKSFDSNLMSLGLSRPVKIAIAGVLYRVIVDPSFTEDARIRFRPAKPDDA